MTTNTLHIRIGDLGTYRSEVEELVQAVDGTDATDDLDVPEDRIGRSILTFGSYDDLVDNLTPLRLELVRAIREHGPESMRETARLVDRDISDVHRDLTRLEVLGLIDLEEHGRATQPVCRYDRIEMHVEYPLADDEASDLASNAE